MFSNQFNVVEEDKEHIQYVHINIDDEEFNKYVIKSVFDDKELYKYVTNDLNEPTSELRKKYPISQLISLIVNMKKEYIKSNIPMDLRRKICRQIRPMVDGQVINVKDSDWEQKFNTYLNNNITGVDVVAEIVLSKIIEEKFNANVFITKLAQVTNNNMKVFGVDTLHYNESTNTMFFGESKLTNNIELGIKEHLDEILFMDYKLNEECKLFALQGNNMRGSDYAKKKISDFGYKLTVDKKISLFNLKKVEKIFNIAIVYFIAHGDTFDYKYVTKKIKSFRKKIHFKDVEIFCITLPIKDKNDFKNRVREVIGDYE